VATLAYGVSGEGRGHAMRARTVIEELRRRHRVVVYTYGDALGPLRQAFPREEVEVRRIPGLAFAYDTRGRLDYPRTAGAALPYLWELGRRSGCLSRELERLGADLVVSDFEPLTARAAARCAIPLVSLDHQQLLRLSSFADAPWRLRLKVRLQRPAVAAFVSGQAHTIVSSFAYPRSMPQRRDVTAAGVLLGRAVREAAPVAGDHLVVYLRRHPPAGLLEALDRIGVPARVYGLGTRPPRGRIRFHPSGEACVEDLACSRALITTAGNQLVGEALFLRKPVLAFPETGNFEQALNAWLLEQSGLGEAHAGPRVGAERLRAFLDRAESWRARIDARRVDGNAAAVGALESCLEALVPRAATRERMAGASHGEPPRRRALASARSAA